MFQFNDKTLAKEFPLPPGEGQGEGIKSPPISFIVFYIIGLIVLLTSCDTPSSDPSKIAPQTSPPLSVQIGKPRIQDVTFSCDLVGVVRPWKTVRISSEIAGKVDALNFEKGDTVQENDLLAEIDPAKAKAAYDQARALYEIAVANHQKMQAISRPQEIDIANSVLEQAIVQRDEAKKNYNRLSSLFKSGNINQRQLDESETQYQVAERQVSTAQKRLELVQIGARSEDLVESEARVAQMEASLRLAKEQWDDSKILAPLRGTIVEKFVEIGELVNIGTPITQLVQVDRVKIVARIPEMEIAKIQIDRPVSVTVDSLPDRMFSGKILFLGVVADEMSHSFPVELAIENPDGCLRPGMIARMNFMTGVQRDALLIGTDMIWNRDNRTGVFTIEENRAVFRPIQLGPSVQNRIMVRSGLEPDQPIIVNAPEGLIDGQSIVVDREIELQ